MIKANKFGLFAVVVALLTSTAGWAAAEVSEESISGYFGHAYIDVATGSLTWDDAVSSPFVGTTVYTNTSSSPNTGASLADLAATWGDRVATVGMGTLEENDFTLFNSGTSAGPVLTATFNIGFFNGATNVALGGYSGSVNFGAGLPPGFYTIITFVGLGGLGINLNTTDVLITQKVASLTGTATRLGIASLDPPTIGSSANTLFINSASVGPAGYYTLGTPPLNANPGYRINVNATVPTQTKSWGSVKADYR